MGVELLVSCRPALRTANLWNCVTGLLGLPTKELICISTAENHVSKQQQWQMFVRNPGNSGKTFFDISVEVEADKLEKLQKHAHLIRLLDKDLV